MAKLVFIDTVIFSLFNHKGKAPSLWHTTIVMGLDGSVRSEFLGMNIELFKEKAMSPAGMVGPHIITHASHKA